MKKMLPILLIISLAIWSLAACAPSNTTGSQKNKATVADIATAFKDKIIEDMEKLGMTADQVFGDDTQEDMGVFFTEDLKQPAGQRRIAVDINADDLAAGFGIQATFNVDSALIIILEAESADLVPGMLETLNGILDQQKELWSQYLQDQYEIVKKTVLKSEGVFIVYITYQNAAELEAIFDDLIN
jgi:hypothetical protein